MIKIKIFASRCCNAMIVRGGGFLGVPVFYCSACDAIMKNDKNGEPINYQAVWIDAEPEK